MKVFAALWAEGMRLEVVKALVVEANKDEADTDVEDAPSWVLAFLRNFEIVGVRLCPQQEGARGSTRTSLCGSRHTAAHPALIPSNDHTASEEIYTVCPKPLVALG